MEQYIPQTEAARIPPNHPESERGVLTVENDAVGDARDNTYFNALDAFLCGAGVLLRFEKTYYEPGVDYGEDGPEPYREERI